MIHPCCHNLTSDDCIWSLSYAEAKVINHCWPAYPISVYCVILLQINTHILFDIFRKRSGSWFPFQRALKTLPVLIIWDWHRSYTHNVLPGTPADEEITLLATYSFRHDATKENESACVVITRGGVAARRGSNPLKWRRLHRMTSRFRQDRLRFLGVRRWRKYDPYKQLARTNGASQLLNYAGGFVEAVIPDTGPYVSRFDKDYICKRYLHAAFAKWRCNFFSINYNEL